MPKGKTPPPELWDEEVLLTRTEGYKEFVEGEIEGSFKKALRLLEPEPKQRIVDIGCGRGEMVKECAKITEGAIGIDYSLAAVKISKEYIGAGNILRASATHLPFKNEVLDKIVMLGFINCLSEEDLEMSLQESKRVLKDGGKILINTPNSWEALFHVLKVGHSLLFRHQRQPLRPDRYDPYMVSSKNPLSLRKIVKKCGFEPKIWFDTRLKGDAPSIVYRILFFARPLWCIATKGGHQGAWNENGDPQAR